MLATEQYANIKCRVLLHISPSDTLQMLEEAYGKASMKKMQLHFHILFPSLCGLSMFKTFYSVLNTCHFLIDRNVIKYAWCSVRLITSTLSFQEFNLIAFPDEVQSAKFKCYKPVSLVTQMFLCIVFIMITI
jgi:hypothetical protein